MQKKRPGEFAIGWKGCIGMACRSSRLLVLKPGTQVPIQPNTYDCGVYLLHFAKTFMTDPKKYAKMIMVW